MLPLVSFWQRGLVSLLLLLLGLARLAAAQAPSFDMAEYCGTAPTSNDNINTSSLTVDAQGNTLLVGSFHGTVSFGSFTRTSHSGVYDAFVAKRSPTGTWLWVASGGGDAGSADCGSVIVDALGQVYVTGIFSRNSGRTTSQASFGSFTLTSTGGADALVAKLDGTTGQWLWATSAGSGTSNGSDETAGSPALDAFGGLRLLGYFSDFRLLAGGLTLYQVGTGVNSFVARLDAATGTWTWATNTGPAGINNLTIDSQGNGYLCGSFSGASLTLGSSTLSNPRVNSYNSQGFVAKINGNGNWLWATALDATYGTGTNGGEGGAYGFGLATDEQNHLYLCGVFSGRTATFGSTTFYNASTTYQGPQLGSIQMGDAFVARLDAATGQWQWAVRGGGEDNEYFGQLLVRNGRVFVGGVFGRQGDMFMPGNPSPLGSPFGTTTLVSAGKYDVMVASLDDTGQWLWAVRAGGTGLDYFGRLASDAAGRIQFLGRYYSPNVQFGSLTLPGSAYSDILARLAGGALPALAAGPAAPWALYPNPARATVTLTGLPAGQPVQVFDVLGRLVLAARTPAQGPLELTLPPGLAAGLYMVRAAGQTRQLLVPSMI